MTGIWDNFKNFFPSLESWFGMTGAPPPGGAERTWSDTASDIWGAVKWLFETFRDSYIVCYRSTNLQTPSERARESLVRFQERWFPSEIYLSQRMGDRAFVIQRFQAHPKVHSIITAFFRVPSQIPDGLKGEDNMNEKVRSFFEDHVFMLPFDRTVRVPNPEPKQAFWLPLDEFRRSLETLIESLAEEEKVKLEEEYESSYRRMRAEEEEALASWPRDVEANSAKRKEIIEEHTQRRRQVRQAIDARIEENKVRVRQEFFADQTIEALAEDPGKLKLRLETYLREHFEED